MAEDRVGFCAKVRALALSNRTWKNETTRITLARKSRLPATFEETKTTPREWNLFSIQLIYVCSSDPAWRAVPDRCIPSAPQ